MINLSRKRYISLLTLVLLFVVAGTVTFAWFKLNTNAWFSDLEIGASSNADLRISVVGVEGTYGSHLTNKQIGSSIIAHSNGWDLTWDDTGRRYSHFNITDKEISKTHNRSSMSKKLPKCIYNTYTY